MTLQQWLQHFESGYNLPFRSDTRTNQWVRRKFTQEEKSFLMQEYSQELVSAQQQHVLEIVQILTRYFFKLALNGQTFGPIEKVRLEFGKTLEEQYGLQKGPFLNLARTYWTFRLELDQDQYNSSNRYIPLLFPILRTVEMNISGVFFPSPGPKVMSVAQRTMRHEQILKEFAPQIDAKRLISESPILRLEASRGCLVVILLMVSLMGLSLFAHI